MMSQAKQVEFYNKEMITYHFDEGSRLLKNTLLINDSFQYIFETLVEVIEHMVAGVRLEHRSQQIHQNDLPRIAVTDFITRLIDALEMRSLFLVEAVEIPILLKLATHLLSVISNPYHETSFSDDHNKLQTQLEKLMQNPPLPNPALRFAKVLAAITPGENQFTKQSESNKRKQPTTENQSNLREILHYKQKTVHFEDYEKKHEEYIPLKKKIHSSKTILFFTTNNKPTIDTTNFDISLAIYLSTIREHLNITLTANIFYILGLHAERLANNIKQKFPHYHNHFISLNTAILTIANSIYEFSAALHHKDAIVALKEIYDEKKLREIRANNQQMVNSRLKEHGLICCFAVKFKDILCDFANLSLTEAPLSLDDLLVEYARSILNDANSIDGIDYHELVYPFLQHAKAMGNRTAVEWINQHETPNKTYSTTQVNSSMPEYMNVLEKHLRK